MQRILVSLLLAVIFAPVAGVAGDKGEPRSLASEAACLAEKSGGKSTWASEQIDISKDGGKTKAKAILHMKFMAKDQPKGILSIFLVVNPGKGPGGGATEMSVWGGLPSGRFALEEKEGKRFVKVMEVKQGPKENEDPKVLGTLEYTLKGEELTIKGAIDRTWGDWDLDLSKPIVLKAGEIKAGGK